jgi:hypothetical protein
MLYPERAPNFRCTVDWCSLQNGSMAFVCWCLRSGSRVRHRSPHWLVYAYMNALPVPPVLCSGTCCTKRTSDAQNDSICSIVTKTSRVQDNDLSPLPPELTKAESIYRCHTKRLNTDTRVPILAYPSSLQDFYKKRNR